MRKVNLLVLTLVVTLALIAGLVVACVPAQPAPPAAAGGYKTYLNSLTVDGPAVISDTTKITAPTAVTTAVPALAINNLGAGNDALVVAKAATPVFKVSNTGVVTGKVLQYATAGQKIVCSSATITGTGTLPTGLATPQVVIASLAQDATGNGARLSTTNASATVTAKIWSSALTPAPATTPVTVNWCVIGQP
jgi:hypothetical protein